jgi:hypothetical protein
MMDLLDSSQGFVDRRWEDVVEIIVLSLADCITSSYLLLIVLHYFPNPRGRLKNLANIVDLFNFLGCPSTNLTSSQIL